MCVNTLNVGNKKRTKYLVSFKVGIVTVLAFSVATTVSMLNNEHLGHDHDSLFVKSVDALNEHTHFHSNTSNHQTRILNEEDHHIVDDNDDRVIAKVSGAEAQKLIKEINRDVGIYFRVLDDDGDGKAVVELLRDDS